uniref:G-protein coupled receptors family 1 profile domain-containing protein n=1 Tax=Panagrolaimus sp. JU765 TaxID=591449 RepID=A0AC34R884_9BILA
MSCLNVNGLQSSSIIGLKVLIISISIDRCLAVIQPVRYAKNDSKVFAYGSGALSLFAVIVMAIAIRIGIDSKPISVCSIGAANTPEYSLTNMIYSGIFIALLFIFYNIALVLTLMRLQSTNCNYTERHLKTQFKIFLTVSWILLTCFLAYCVPTIIQLAGKIFNFGSDVNAWSTLYSGFASVINASINVFLYLFKHYEINHCFQVWLSNHFSGLQKPKLTSSKIHTGASHSGIVVY